MQTKANAMAIAIYTALLPVCSFTVGVFGFFVGRCARKIPLLDDNLPRALYRGQLPPKGFIDHQGDRSSLDHHSGKSIVTGGVHSSLPSYPA
jgi:hypothetical protein